MDAKGSYPGYADPKPFEYNLTAVMKCGTVKFRQHRSMLLQRSESGLRFAAALGAPTEFPGPTELRCDAANAAELVTRRGRVRSLFRYQLLARAYEVGSWTGFTIHVHR
jgi:hypothetical protein